MPNISQQDYIIIDWEGNDDSDAAKKAEVDAQLKNIYLANPLALLSVLFKNYGLEDGRILTITSIFPGDGEISIYIQGDDGSASEYIFPQS